jgi:PAS domain S-box-containing protein
MAASIEVNYAQTSHTESATTLRTVVELVRRITHADVISIVSFSLAEKTMTWKAASGFQSHVIDDQRPLIRPLTNRIANRALTENGVMILEGLGENPNFPAENFPVHMAEGVRDLAIATLKARGETLGALLAGYRSAHQFTDDEKELLQDLADMAAVTLDNARLLETANKSQARMAKLIDSAMDAVISVDAEQRVVLFNPAAERMFGCAAVEALGSSLDRFIPTRFRDVHRGHVEKFGQMGVTARRMGALGALSGLRTDGEEFPIEASISHSEVGGQKLFTVILRDITERRRAEDALRESEARAWRGQKIWEETFDAIGEGILVYDRRMRIVRCNARAAEMMEMQPADIIGLSFTDAFARLFGKQAAGYYLAEDRETSSAFEVRTESGRRNLVSIFSVEQPDGDSISVVTLNDVTRMSEMQEQLGRSRRLASVGQLAAGVAHEINNPLAAITTCAEATIRDLRQDSETQALAESHQWNYYLEEIVRQSLRCKEITRGLLDLTRQRQAQRAQCNLNSIARQCAKVALQRAGSAIEFEIDLDQNIGEVASDTAMLRQILDNLLSNAIDALGGNEGKIHVSTRRDGDRLVLEVADTGCGIPADSLARIFDPFFSLKGPGKGYGLGLAICSTLAESLGGAITVESREGEGSRFRLWIPRRAPEE